MDRGPFDDRIRAMFAATSASISSTQTARLAARDAAVVCDLAPLSVLAVGGPDAAVFLQGQLSADIESFL